MGEEVELLSMGLRASERMRCVSDVELKSNGSELLALRRRYVRADPSAVHCYTC